jgi:hypothetical protein
MKPNERYYNYRFDNGETHQMTPIEAHRYVERKKIKISYGPGYEKGKREKSFDGWGWHDGLLRSFKGPKDYRDYLKANGMVEAAIGDKPTEWKSKKPLWDEDLIRKATGLGLLSATDGKLTEALLNGELDYPDGSTEFDLEEEL